METSKKERLVSDLINAKRERDILKGALTAVLSSEALKDEYTFKEDYVWLLGEKVNLVLKLENKLAKFKR